MGVSSSSENISPNFDKNYSSGNNEKLELLLTNGRKYKQENLWTKKKFLSIADVSIFLDNVEYRLNKKIISLSSMLSSLVSGGFQESFQEKIYLDTDEITRLGWEYCLNYMYSLYSNGEKNLIPIIKLDIYNIIEIFMASNYLQIDILLNQTTKILTNITQQRLNPLYNRDILTQQNKMDIVNLIDNVPGFNIILSNLSDLDIAIILTIYNEVSDKEGYELVYNILERFMIKDHLNTISELNYYIQPQKDIYLLETEQKYIIKHDFFYDLIINYLSLEYLKYGDYINELFLYQSRSMCHYAPSRRANQHLTNAQFSALDCRPILHSFLTAERIQDSLQKNKN